MKALIIAAGEGKRLKGLSRKSPKPLIKLLGLSLIERVIFNLRQASITDIVIVIGYEAEKIKNYLGSGEKYNVNINYIENQEWKRGNGISVLKAKNYFQEEFLLLMNDHLFDSSIIEEVKNTKLGEFDCGLVVDKNPSFYLDLEDATKVIVKDERIVKIGKGLSEFNGVDCGIFLCKEKIFEELEKSISEGKETLTEGMQEIADKNKLMAIDSKGKFWIDIDTPLSFKRAEEILSKNLLKPTDGFIARKFNRPISLRISKFLVNTKLTPNFISFISFFMCLVASLFFAIGNYLTTIIGGIVAQLASIVDGCDGEIARLKFQSSDYGAWFDRVIDRYADAIVILGLMLGLWREGFNPWIIGYLAMIGSFMNSYTAIKYDNLFKKREKNNLRFGRDTRYFLIMIFALLNQVYLLLYLLAFLTNLVSLRRLYILRKHL